MDDDKLIERLEEGVREAEELLQRRKQALAALKGKSPSAKRTPGSGSRGFRPTSIPGHAYAVLKGKPALSLEELTVAVKKYKPEVDSRGVSVALSKYVRNGRHFAIVEGKYTAK
jgi:hypothetical protein